MPRDSNQIQPYMKFYPQILVVTLLLLLTAGCGPRELRPLNSDPNSPSQLNPTARIMLLQDQLETTQDSLDTATLMLDLLNDQLVRPSDSMLTRHALTLWKRGQSDDALTLLAMVDGRDSGGSFGGRRGAVFMTLFMLISVVIGFIYVALRMIRRLFNDRQEFAYNRAIAALAGLLIYFVFSVAGLSLPVLILNSLGEVKPLYSVILNFLSMLLGATATLFVGTMVQSNHERTVLLGIILGVFTSIFFIDMLFKALFFAFDMRVLLPNTMFVLGVVLVYLFASNPKSSRRQEFAEGY